MELYKIDDRARTLLDRMDEYVDEETGEVDSSFATELEALGIEAKWKIEAIGVICKELAGNTKMVADEIARLKARKVAMENRKAWLVNYVSDVMKSMDIGKHISPQGLFTVYLQKNPDKVTVEYPDNLPMKYIRVRPVEPILTDLRQDMKDGRVTDKIIGDAGIVMLPGAKKVRFK